MLAFIKSRSVLLFASVISIIGSELFESTFEKHQLLKSILLGIVVMFLFIYWENVRNKLSFYDGIIEIIKQLRLLNQKNNINSEDTQQFMTKIVATFQGIFDVKKLISKNTMAPTDFEEGTKLPCKICKAGHSTTRGGGCSNCKLPSGLWAGLNE